MHNITIALQITYAYNKFQYIAEIMFVNIVSTSYLRNNDVMSSFAGQLVVCGRVSVANA